MAKNENLKEMLRLHMANGDTPRKAAWRVLYFGLDEDGKTLADSGHDTFGMALHIGECLYELGRGGEALGTVDPNTWDPGAGAAVSTEVTAGCWQIQRLLVGDRSAPELTISRSANHPGLPKTPLLLPKKPFPPIVLEYGRNAFRGDTLYVCLSEAVAAAKMEFYCGQSLLVVQQGCTDLLDGRTAVFLNWVDGEWQ